VLNGAGLKTIILGPRYTHTHTHTPPTSFSTQSAALVPGILSKFVTNHIGATNGLIPNDNKRFSFRQEAGRKMFATWVAWMTAWVEDKNRVGRGGEGVDFGFGYIFYFIFSFPINSVDKWQQDNGHTDKRRRTCC